MKPWTQIISEKMHMELLEKKGRRPRSSMEFQLNVLEKWSTDYEASRSRALRRIDQALQSAATPSRCVEETWNRDDATHKPVCAPAPPKHSGRFSRIAAASRKTKRSAAVTNAGLAGRTCTFVSCSQ